MNIKNSLKQMFRTPVRTVLFLALLILAAALVTLGGSLWFLSGANLRKIEGTFTTIGTVQQRRSAVKEIKRWDAQRREEETYWIAEYDTAVPVTALDFEGADYTKKPEKRPFYGAYVPDIWIIDTSTDHLIVEASPVEDCVPDHPVKLELHDILWGSLGYCLGDVYFCDHYNENPPMLYADRHYMMNIQSREPHQDSRKDGILREFVPVSLEGAQYTKDGRQFETKVGVPEGYEEITEDFDEPGGPSEIWKELILTLKRHEHEVPVNVTNSTKLLMAFCTGEAYICEGRDITEEEYGQGERVCLVSREMAQPGTINGWKVGDEIKLPLYYADYRTSPGYYFQDSGFSYPDGLNAEGKSFSVFSEHSYRIVGIYDTLPGASLSDGYSMGDCEIIVPMNSVEESDEDNIVEYGPMMGYTTSFQIPNGSMDSFMEAWEKQGIDDLDITFYDGGYSQIKEGLEQMMQMGVILFAAGAVTALLILILFSRLFIGKQKRRTAIERSLGLSRRKCRHSLLAGMMLIVLLGCTAGCVTGTLFTKAAAEKTGWEMEFDTTYSSGNLRVEGTVSEQEMIDYGVLNGSVGIAAGVCLILAAYIIAFMETQRNLASEPLELLSVRD